MPAKKTTDTAGHALDTGEVLAVNTTVGADTFPAGTKVGDVVAGVEFSQEILDQIDNPKAFGEAMESADVQDDSPSGDAE